MKKILASIASLAMLLLVVSPVFAVKPSTNLAAAQKVDWNLSGAVMPVPPWGLHDIAGSDTLSKLIVNQPNGITEVAITGAMNGLLPNTTYTVYPAKAWSTSEKWNIVGDWDLRFVLGGNYDHNMNVTFQNMWTGAFLGTGHSLTSASTTWNIQGSSNVIGNTIHLDLIYTGSGAGYTVEAIGTIDQYGHIINGNWKSSANQVGTWTSLSGTAEKVTVGNGFPGLFGSLQTFTFVTDEFGSGSWHLNLRDSDFPLGGGIYLLSIWVNGGGATVLVSDPFEVVVN